MKKSHLLTIAAAAFLIVPVAGAQAAKAASKDKAKSEKTAPKETEAQLKAAAKISEAEATKTALAKVPKGTVKSMEIERENGKLIYSFDIATKGKSGIDEVQVDAITGAIVGKVEHEDAKAEAKEAKAEAKEKKKP